MVEFIDPASTALLQQGVLKRSLREARTEFQSFEAHLSKAMDNSDESN
jgi:hypothetical protein